MPGWSDVASKALDRAAIVVFLVGAAIVILGAAGRLDLAGQVVMALPNAYWQIAIGVVGLAVLVFGGYLLKRDAGSGTTSLVLTALESTPVPLWVGDRDLRIVYMNPALANLLGVIREDYVGLRKIEDLIAASTRFMDPSVAAEIRERQLKIGAAFRRGEWPQGEDVINLTFDEKLRPGGRSGKQTFRVIANRIEKDGKWVGGMAVFQEVRP